MQVTFKEITRSKDATDCWRTAPDATLTTRQGEDVKLSSYFGNQPVSLVLF